MLFEYASDYLLTGSYDVQTPGYRAPEALLRCSFSENIDVWSIGVVLVELLMSERLVPEGAEDVQAVSVVGDGGSLLVSHLTSLTSHHTLYTSPINHQSPSYTKVKARHLTASKVLPILSRLLGRLPCPATT